MTLPATPMAITALVPVAPAAAWADLTDPQAIMQWNRAAPGWRCPDGEFELRVGGRHAATIDAARQGGGGA